MLEQEEAFYEAHQAEFREKYLNKWLVIAGDALIGTFDTPKEAFLTVQERHIHDGRFMIHRPADDNLVVGGPFISVSSPDLDDETEARAVTTVVEGDPVVITYA